MSSISKWTCCATDPINLGENDEKDVRIIIMHICLGKYRNILVSLHERLICLATFPMGELRKMSRENSSRSNGMSETFAYSKQLDTLLQYIPDRTS